MILRHLLALLCLLVTTAAAATPVQTEHVEAELVAENLSFKAGPFDNWIALRLRPDADWHVYWQNPGDSGIPTKLELQLPAGVTAGPMQWPYPHRQSLGELTNYGYSSETLHLVPVRVQAGSRIRLTAKAKWLVCKDICIPGEAALSLDMPVSDAMPQADPSWKSAFEQARAQLPRSTPGWDVHYAIADGEFSLSVQGAQFPPRARIEFFPLANDLVSHAAEQRIAIDPVNGLRLSEKLSAYFVEAPAELGGVLVVHADDQTLAYQLDAKPGAVTPVAAATALQMRAVPAGPMTTGAPVAQASLIGMLFFALIGGLILNLMPCVFPVLAIKALSVMRARGESDADHRRHSVVYTLGVVASFLTVAGLLMALRAGGAALGWGFQLQSPGFVFALIVVIFVMGLSLSGAVHFGASWMGAGQRLAQRPGLAGSFFTGVLAVVVASPCTAPLMAPALGFALVQPAAIALLVFAALGLGLALPFLLMGFVPRLAALLPRPGAWMERFKQLMAFPMYLTAVWLLWVLGGLTDRDGMGIALVGLVLVAFAVWLLAHARSGVGQGLAMLAMLAVLGLALHPALRMKPGAVSATSQTREGYETYTDTRFAQLRAQGRSVFVDFTADWCLTCKINERGVLRSAAVRDSFRRHDVALLVGDWTRADPAITAVLARYGRSGVPLYLVSRDGAEPVVLPQVLTAAAITDALE